MQLTNAKVHQQKISKNYVDIKGPLDKTES